MNGRRFSTTGWFALLLTVSINGCAVTYKLEPKPLPAVIIYISEEYLNINTDLSQERLAAVGITAGTSFTSTYEGRTVQALLGTSYADVERGEWIAQIEEDGKMQLAISFGHAAMELDCSVGDTLLVHPPR
jgi:S-adenosylmethionine hydrolase